MYNLTDIPKILNASETTITNQVEIANVFDNYFFPIDSYTKANISYSLVV